MNSRSKKSVAPTKLVRTFTYFIPAPAHRKSGYREREFDKIMNGILQSGFEIVQFQTESVESGVFILAIIKAPNKKIWALDLDLDIQEKFKLSHEHSSPEFIMEEDET